MGAAAVVGARLRRPPRPRVPAVHPADHPGLRARQVRRVQLHGARPPASLPARCVCRLHRGAGRRPRVGGGHHPVHQRRPRRWRAVPRDRGAHRRMLGLGHRWLPVQLHGLVRAELPAVGLARGLLELGHQLSQARRLQLLLRLVRRRHGRRVRLRLQRGAEGLPRAVPRLRQVHPKAVQHLRRGLRGGHRGVALCPARGRHRVPVHVRRGPSRLLARARARALGLVRQGR
mmetsp:Transcript_82509/g.229595  ORF Transcript_82509/g.229595 Transcript_82509/m.229595 type:complete len:231 (+) Transcript_82509:112-804(+)